MIFPYLFSNLDFAALFQLISPSFFKVASPTVLVKIASELKGNYSDTKTWEKTLNKILSEYKNVKFSSRKNSGERALELFFFQILTQETWILDFRGDAFNAENNEWNPKPLYYKISTPFLQNIRELYQGFYESDPPRFDLALKKLGLLNAKDALRKHFGEGDQTKVQFRLKTFQETFTEVFAVCKQEGIKLQPEFFVLGLMLLTLYQNLESKGEPCNARQSFANAKKAAKL